MVEIAAREILARTSVHPAPKDSETKSSPPDKSGSVRLRLYARGLCIALDRKPLALKLKGGQLCLKQIVTERKWTRSRSLSLSFVSGTDLVLFMFSK